MGLSPFSAGVEAWVLFILASLSLAQGRASGRHGGNAHELKSTEEGRAWNILCLPSYASQGKGKETSPTQTVASTQVGSLRLAREETRQGKVACMFGSSGGHSPSRSFYRAILSGQAGLRPGLTARRRSQEGRYGEMGEGRTGQVEDLWTWPWHDSWLWKPQHHCHSCPGPGEKNHHPLGRAQTWSGHSPSDPCLEGRRAARN